MVDKNLRRMLRLNTPIEDYREEYGLLVKREDLSCKPPGPPFSKTRGVYSHLRSRPETLIGVLDTYHSQGGHAVSRACQILGKQCINYYPEYKHEPGFRLPQQRSRDLGAKLVGLKAGRSAILYHQAKRECVDQGGYMMPNALKLEESVIETAKEVPKSLKVDWVVIPISSATIAAGVILGFLSRMGMKRPKFVLHMGYSRSEGEVRRYVVSKLKTLRPQSTLRESDVSVVDESYSYKDVARSGPTPPFPCNEYYDLKTFRWWMSNRSDYKGTVLFWNIG